MMLPYAEPDIQGAERAALSRRNRALATAAASDRPHVLTAANDEESDHSPQCPVNFTKGLAHHEYGLVDHGQDYRDLVRAVNTRDGAGFTDSVETAETRDAPRVVACAPGGRAEPLDELGWRGWESPRAGHAFDLEGPDAGAVGMAPAPRASGSELAGELAELYAMALLRDVPFTAFGDDDPTTIDGGQPGLSPAQAVGALNTMAYFTGEGRVSSMSSLGHRTGLDAFERARRAARTDGDVSGPVTVRNLFRGSTRGARTGPYVSQFMLVGNDGYRDRASGQPRYPARRAGFDAAEGYIRFGSQIIDQRIAVARCGLDYMTDWPSWLDVQQGWDYRGLDRFERQRRFITTPRDLATYVHIDQLYQAYVNACLLLLGVGAETARGFPEPDILGRRAGFATFGGPHILTLVPETATRCLKAVRRQKFNFHRRARPEAVAARLVLAAGFDPSADPSWPQNPLGAGQADIETLLAAVPTEILEAVVGHNGAQNDRTDRWLSVPGTAGPPPGLPTFDDVNYLLPMAFPEGSPMHPAYGAGHATVAGGCVTMLKAFFEMFDPRGPNGEKVLRLGDADHYVPSADGTELIGIDDAAQPLTIQGELDKLAANIAIGRNLAGVHYYSDYFDSLRLGERVSVGILLEQVAFYGDPVEMTFTSFDGDYVEIDGEPGSRPRLTIRTSDGVRVPNEQWWLRHAYARDDTGPDQAA